MNAQDLWSGSDYAHTDNISRGVSYYERANRVKVVRVFKIEPSYGETKKKTMVDVLVCNDDGSVKQSYAGTDMTRTVRARDIFMRWDEYASERRHRHEKREQIAQQQAEQQARDEESKAALMAALEEKGINRLWVTSVTEYTVAISRRELNNWLGV